MLRCKARQDVYRFVFVSDGELFVASRPLNLLTESSDLKPGLQTLHRASHARGTPDAPHVHWSRMKHDAREPETLLFRGASCIAGATPADVRHCSAPGQGPHLYTTFHTPTLSRRLLPRICKLSPFQSLVKEQCSASRLRIAMVPLKSARVLILSASKSDRDSIQN